MSLKTRLDKLEAHPAFVRHTAQPADPTDDEIGVALCTAFEFGWLRCAADGAVVVDESAGKWRTGLTAAAAKLNEGRAPILPMSPEDATTAAAMLRRGWVRLVDGTFCTERGKRIGYDYRLFSRDALPAMDMARKLDSALNVFEASGGVIEPFTAEAIAALLDSAKTLSKRG